jgi:C-terminal processing protease CtpA/Prc
MNAQLATNDVAAVFSKAVSIVQNRFFDPKFNGLNWTVHTQARASFVLEADTPEEFAHRFDGVLAELKAHPTRFYRQSEATLPLQKAAGATVRRVSNGWMIQDVLMDGPAANAGLEPGDVIVAIDGNQAGSSAPMLRTTAVEHDLRVAKRTGAKATVRLVGRKPRRFISCSTPEGGVGYVSVSMFPGLVGIDFARELDAAISTLRECRSLIVDLRGNPGGGSGNLRLMSYLTGERRPVGYSLTRPRAERGYQREQLAQFRRIPSAKVSLLWLAMRFKFSDKSIVVVTEGLGKQTFHGRVVMLVNEHTTSGAEIVAGFAKDHGLATLVGQCTAGRLLGWSTFRLEPDYRLVIPVSNYLTWEGKCFEGIGVVPDVEIDFSEDAARQGVDVQMEKALAIARSL